MTRIFLHGIITLIVVWYHQDSNFHVSSKWPWPFSMHTLAHCRQVLLLFIYFLHIPYASSSIHDFM